MKQKIKRIKSEELYSCPVIKDIECLNESDLLNSHKNKSKIRRVAVIAIITLIALLYITARLKI